MRALVTGASSGIGLEISKMLVELGYEVDGIGRNFWEHVDGVNEIVVDLLDDKKVDYFLDTYKPKDLNILINNAGCAYYGMHEELRVKSIREMNRVNLEIPMILTSKLLRRLKENQGYIINISSVSGIEYAVKGGCYGATKAGLLAFSKNIMAENRKYGLKSICIVPDMTDTKLYRNSDIGVKEGCYLDPIDVSNTIKWILENNKMLIEEIVLRPQYAGICRKIDKEKR